MKMKVPSTTRTLLLLLIAVTVLSSASARPYKDSPIKTIVVPYQPNVVSGKPYQRSRSVGESRRVLVPESTDMLPNFPVNYHTISMSSQKGVPVSFAEGAYPVYYMPSNVNGRFNGKIALLS